MSRDIVQASCTLPGSSAGVSRLSALLPRAVAYEDWRCPLDPALRRGAQLAGLLASLLSLVFVPLAVSTGYPLAVGLAAIEVAVVVVFLATLIATHGLESVSRVWHKVAYGLVLTEAPQGFLVSVSIVAGAVAAILLAVLSAIVAFLFIAGLAGSSSK